VVEQAGHLLHSDAAAIFGFDTEQRCLHVLAVHNLPQEVASLQVSYGAGLSGRASQSGEITVLHDMQQAFEAFLYHADTLPPEARQALMATVASFRTAVAIPLHVEGELFGTLALYYTTMQTLDEETLALLRTFADQTTLLVENAHLRERVERAAVEAERNRIARDLHDAVTQTLFSASILADVIPRIAERKIAPASSGRSACDAPLPAFGRCRCQPRTPTYRDPPRIRGNADGCQSSVLPHCAGSAQQCHQTSIPPQSLRPVLE